MSTTASPSTDDAVCYNAHGRIGVITLNRPDNRNSMTPELLASFEKCARQAASDVGIRCVVITGEGRCFSAGADLKSQIQSESGDRALTPAERSYAMYTPFLSILDIQVPVIAAMNGHAIGGGFGLALACDIRIANSDAKYGANFARLGLASGMAISYVLPRLVGVEKAAELLFTGRIFKGDEAASMGLVSRAVLGDSVLEQAMGMAQTIAESAPIAVRLMKRSLYQGLSWDLRGAARQEADAQASTVNTADFKEGMTALLEKRAPDFHGK